jgi:hypothetical protein
VSGGDERMRAATSRLQIRRMVRPGVSDVIATLLRRVPLVCHDEDSCGHGDARLVVVQPVRFPSLGPAELALGPWELAGCAAGSLDAVGVGVLVAAGDAARA